MDVAAEIARLETLSPADLRERWIRGESIARIAERSRLVVSHGGHGFVSSALLAGLPHVVTPYDLEKQIHADRLVALGLGGQVALQAIRAAPFAESLARIHDDEGFGIRARAAAPGFHAQMRRPMAKEVTAAVASLVP